MKNTNNRRRRPYAKPLTASLALVVLAGQRLRADETASAATFRLGYAAKWAQATGGAR